MNKRRVTLGTTLAAGAIAITATAVALRPSPAPPGAVKISSNGAGMTIVRLPRGVLWATLDFEGPPGLTHLNHGVPAIDGRNGAIVASAARPDTFVIWAFADGPDAPVGLRYQSADGQTHTVAFNAAR